MAMKQFTVPDEADGQRIDVCIRRYLPEIDAIRVREAFSRRDVKADGKRVKQDFRLRSGQTVCVYYPDSFTEQKPDVVYEDERVLVVNKPSGISVVPDDGPGLCLAETIRRSFGYEVIPCHRLDNKTCGLCIFAKDHEAEAVLLDVFRERKLEKYYICLVRGMMKPTEAICKAWLVKDEKAGRVTVTDHPVPGAKQIVTAYTTLENGSISRLRVHLITGRTHQIRAHMAAMGHPLLGDDVYGDRSYNRIQKQRSLKLCAVEMSLDTDGRLPLLDGKKFVIQAPF